MNWRWIKQKCERVCYNLAYSSDFNEIWYVGSMAYESMIREKIVYNCWKFLKYIVFCFVTKLAIQGVVLGPLSPVYVTLLIRFLWIGLSRPYILFWYTFHVYWDNITRNILKRFEILGEKIVIWEITWKTIC